MCSAYCISGVLRTAGCHSRRGAAKAMCMICHHGCSGCAQGTPCRAHMGIGESCNHAVQRTHSVRRKKPGVSLIVDEAQFILIRGMDRLNGEPQQCILILPVLPEIRIHIFLRHRAAITPSDESSRGERNQRMQRQGLGSRFWDQGLASGFRPGFCPKPCYQISFFGCECRYLVLIFGL